MPSDTVGSTRTDPNTPCHHCGLPVGRHPAGSDPWFCCTGCQTVYFVLKESGLAETYYRLQESTSRRENAQAAVTTRDPLLLAELDSPEFLKEHTVELEDGCRRTGLYVNGVHCAACVWLVERLPKEIEGVGNARLDLPRSRLTIEWDPQKTRLSTVAGWLSRFGYAVQPRVHDDADLAIREERALLVRVGVSWALAANVMLIAFAMYAGLEDTFETDLGTAARWLSLLLAVPAVVYGAAPFFKKAWASVRHALRRRSFLHLHMDTPISIGILVGFTNSAWSTLSGTGEIWFDSITILIAALLTARWVQFRSRRLAGDAADQLLGLIPTSARKLKEDGSVAIVRASSLQRGDRVQVAAGEVIPVDGIVVDGTSYVDNATLTGESEPLAVTKRSQVWAGATNLAETIRIRTLAVGDQSKVGKLMAWVADEQLHRAPVTMLADRLSGYFVASVLLLAVVCALLWLAVNPSAVVSNVVALLVITCPCALGMATPLAVAVGIGRAARKGIFVKNESAVQTLTEVQRVVLDKTGTLTSGQTAVTDFEGDAGSIRTAARLEADSNHPIARAIRAFVPETFLAAEPGASQVRTEIGKGVCGIVDGEKVAVGRLDWIAEGARVPQALREAELAYAGTGATPVGIAIEGEVTAVLAVSDELRPDASRLVNLLNDRHVEVFLCSGDHEATVRAIARELGIPAGNVFARCDPEEKRDVISRLGAGDRTVAMVGDGVNDAGALQRADVGIAVSGSSVAGQVSSDVFITGRGIDSVSALFRGARRIMRTIRLNLAISLAYNLAGASAAMVGIVTPLVAAVAMPVSSLVVVLLSSTQRPFAAHRGE